MTIKEFCCFILVVLALTSCNGNPKDPPSNEEKAHLEKKQDATWQTDTIFDRNGSLSIRYEADDMLYVTWIVDGQENKACIDSLIPTGESYLLGAWEIWKTEDYFFVRLHRGIPKFRDFLFPQSKTGTLQNFDTPIFYDSLYKVVVQFSSLQPNIVLDIHNIDTQEWVGHELCSRNEWMNEAYGDLDTIYYLRNKLYVRWTDASAVIHDRTVLGPD